MPTSSGFRRSNRAKDALRFGPYGFGPPSPALGLGGLPTEIRIGTLAAATSEETDTIMDVYEPYLIQLGFLQRTPRGRVATRRAYEHLGIPMPSARDTADQPQLFQDNA